MYSIFIVLLYVWNKMLKTKKIIAARIEAVTWGGRHQYVSSFFIALNRKLSKTVTYACEIDKNFLIN